MPQLVFVKGSRARGMVSSPFATRQRGLGGCQNRLQDGGVSQWTWHGALLPVMRHVRCASSGRGANGDVDPDIQCGTSCHTPINNTFDLHG